MQYPMYLIILMWRNAWPIKKSDTDVLYHCNMCAGHGTNSVGDKPTTGSYRQV